jgi:hypothetical protein
VLLNGEFIRITFMMRMAVYSGIFL